MVASAPSKPAAITTETKAKPKASAKQETDVEELRGMQRDQTIEHPGARGATALCLAENRVVVMPLAAETVSKVQALRSAGSTMAEIAMETGLSAGTIQKALRQGLDHRQGFGKAATGGAAAIVRNPDVERHLMRDVRMAKSMGKGEDSLKRLFRSGYSKGVSVALMAKHQGMTEQQFLKWIEV